MRTLRLAGRPHPVHPEHGSALLLTRCRHLHRGLTEEAGPASVLRPDNPSPIGRARTGPVKREPDDGHRSRPDLLPGLMTRPSPTRTANDLLRSGHHETSPIGSRSAFSDRSRFPPAPEASDVTLAGRSPCAKTVAGRRIASMNTRQPGVPSPTSSISRTPAADREAWHTLTVAEVAARLRTDAGRGLAEAEAARRLRQHGPNALAETPGRSPLAIFAAQFRSLIVLLLVAATGGRLRDGRDDRGGRDPRRHRPERGHRVPDRVAGGAGADGAPEAGRRGGPGDPRRGGARGPRGRAGARGRRRHRGRGAGARRRPGGRGRAAADRGGGADGRIARRRQGHRPDRRPRRAAGRPRQHGLHGHDDHRRPRPADRHGHRHADRDGQDRRPDRRGRRPGTPPWSGSSPSSAMPWSWSCWPSAR